MNDHAELAADFGPLEEVRCALCGGGESRLVVRERWFGEDFRVVRCRRCRLIYTNPRPTAEWKRRFYDPERNPYLQQDGRSFCYQPTDESAFGNAPLFRYLKGQFPAGGRLLDGGCSSGLMVKAARDHGFDAMGFDYAPRAAIFAHHRYGVSVLATDVEKIGLLDDSFDVVTLIQVFEHFKDPMTSLAELKRILKPGGLLFIETVNYLKLYWLERYLPFLKPLYFKVRKHESSWWKNRLPWVPFDHYYHWTPGTILAALERAEFERCENHYFPNYDPWTNDGRSHAQKAYRSAIDLLFRFTGRKIAGVLVATGRKPL
jgi:2-polyprenyl-3-methyl-5-hydroxy-6-metoxy-1,4-benzoquinol methylase